MKINYKVLILILSINTIILTANDSNAISFEKNDITSELVVLYLQDQSDRQLVLSKDSGYDINSLKIADSIRLEKIIKFDKNNLLLKSRDKYYASFIYLHSGNNSDKREYYQRGIELCDEIISSSINDTLLYLYSQSEFERIEDIYGSFLSKIEDFQPQQLYDGSILVKIALKFKAKSLKNLHQNKLDSKNADKIVIKSKEDLENYKKSLRTKIRQQLREKFPDKEFSKEEIESLLQEELEWLKSIIDKAKESENISK